MNTFTWDISSPSDESDPSKSLQEIPLSDRAPASELSAAYASAVHPGDEATALLDGRRVGAVGAAWCNGVLANVLDYDDGHRLTKGHPGAVVIPAALAAAQLADATAEELLVAVVVGYEIAIRAGVALHARDDGYHASGAWGGLGAAAAASRLLGLDAAAIHNAIGLAEYHAPIAHIMRSVAQPADDEGRVRLGRVRRRELRAHGRRRASRRSDAAFLDEDAGDLGSSWRLEELYLKAYPCCRWSQGAIRAALEARGSERFAPDDVEAVTITTFAAADALAKVLPATTEEAQYNLVWPVATAVASGDFTVADVLGPWGDPGLMDRTRVVIDPSLTDAFPARRLTAVEIALRDGRRLAAGPLEAAGEPGADDWAEVVAAKVAEHVDPDRDLADPPLTLGTATPAELLGLLCDPVASPARA